MMNLLKKEVRMTCPKPSSPVLSGPQECGKTKLSLKMNVNKAVTLKKGPSRHLQRFMDQTMMLWEVWGSDIPHRFQMSVKDKTWLGHADALYIYIFNMAIICVQQHLKHWNKLICISELIDTSIVKTARGRRRGSYTNR